MKKKIEFTMGRPQPKKHSVRFDLEMLEADAVPDDWTADQVRAFKPSFYIPRPFAENATKILVTIEEF